MKNKAIITRIHLVISVIVVIPAAFIYGFDLTDFLNLNPSTLDEKSFYKAVTGIYLTFSLLWIWGVFKSQLLATALISNMVFMLGLGLGRTISIVLDGPPSMIYLVGTLGELVLGLYGLWLLNSKYCKKM
jgi:drug/metabolite transporter superfamily protein YnfA